MPPRAVIQSPVDGHRGCVHSCPLRAAENGLAFRSRQRCWHRRGRCTEGARGGQGRLGEPPPFPRDRLVGALLGPGLGGEDSFRESGVLGSQPSTPQGKETPHPATWGPRGVEAMRRGPSLGCSGRAPPHLPALRRWSGLCPWGRGAVAISLSSAFSTFSGPLSLPPSPLQTAPAHQRGTANLASTERA